MSSNGIRENMERERVDRDALQEYGGAYLREWEAERRRTSGEWHVGRGDSRLCQERTWPKE